MTVILPSVPVVVIEEHHEAFFVWQESVGQGWIPPAGNTLLHVDHHADFESSKLKQSVESLPNETDALMQYTYQNLGIASFIVPALYQGLINRLVWLDALRYGKTTKSNYYVASWNGEGCHFTTGEVTSLFRLTMTSQQNQWQHHQLFRLEKTKLSNTLQTSQQVILDIDLDFFSCDNGLSSADTCIEITEEAYDAFVAQPYHPMRLLPVAALSPHCEETVGGMRFYLRYDECQEIPNKHKRTEKQIDRLIEHFIEFLKRSNITPGVITLCRSRLSGYTPTDQWQLIEYKLLTALRLLYDTNVIPMQFLRINKTCLK